MLVAGAAAAGWMTHRDKADGFQVASPSTWIVLPHSKAAALRLAAALTRQGKAHQAGLVRSYATDGWQNTPTRVFDAVVYPAPAVSPIATGWPSLTVPRWHGPEKRSGTASSKQPPRRGMTEPGTILAR